MRHSQGCAHRAGVTEVTVKALHAAPGRCLIAMATAPSCGAAAARRTGPASWREAQAQRLERAGGPSGGCLAPEGDSASFSVSFNRVFRPFRGQKRRLNLVKAYILVYILCNTKL